MIFPKEDIRVKGKGGTMGGTMGGIKIRLTDQQLEIMKLVEDDPTVSISEIADKLNINRSAVQKRLERLKKKGIIKRVGGTRGEWKIDPGYQHPEQP